MAKRKRLTPAQSDYLDTETPALETKSIPFPQSRAPIAQVAGDSAAAAALDELASEVQQARAEGRMIQDLPERMIDEGYLVRDRIEADDDEMAALKASIEARGQQTPIEVVELDRGRYGLISGWRRLTAIRQLLSETKEDRFSKIRAVLRSPETAGDAYVAMVEENEIRVGLSYYERARVVAKATEQGVYDGERYALLALFGTASRAKRSKIGSFLTLVHALDRYLRFPSAISERMGMALAKALEAAPEGAEDLREALQAAAPKEAKIEQAVLSTWLRKANRRKSLNLGLETKPQPLESNIRAMPQGVERFSDGVLMTYSGHSLTLSGGDVTESFRRRLREWLQKNS